MPDSDEKYVVRSTAGLGRAEIGITMTQGWGLYGLNARIDNSGIAKPMLDFFSSVFGALGKLASSKITPLIAATGAPQRPWTPDQWPPANACRSRSRK